MAHNTLYQYTVISHPSTSLTPTQQRTLLSECTTLGHLSLTPLPNYQIFSSSPHPLTDKIIVTARSASGALIAFTSAVRLRIPGLSSEVVHTGLTIVHPDVRRGSLVTSLFARLFFQLLAESPKGLWLTSIAEVPSSLVHIALYCTDVHPHPATSSQSQAERDLSPHLHIARTISTTPSLRSALAISPTAEWDEESFVFRGSNDWEGGHAFMKDVDDERYWHRDRALNEWYRALFRKNRGDEVLQVAWLDPGRIRKILEMERFDHLKEEAEGVLSRPRL